MSDFLWQLDRVTFLGAAGGRPRLSEITAGIGPEVTAVLGRSGAGKTSLLNLLVGFESPDSGAVVRGPAFEASQDRAPLFWSPGEFGVWPGLTVRDQVRVVVPEVRGEAEAQATVIADADAKADALLAAFDLASIAHAKPHRLSQGERSRLSVARALASGAKVLVMDEPLAHVDPARLGVFWAVIRGHLQSTGASLVFSTHHAETVLAEASRVICLDAGRLVYDGSVAALYRSPPTLEAARCLGEVNWLGCEDARVWLSAKDAARLVATPSRSDDTRTSTPDTRTSTPDTRFFSLRPEHLEFFLDPGSPIVVQSIRFRGSISDVQLHHTQHDVSRGFVCRSPARLPATGDRVSLRILLLLLLLCLFIAGCGGGGDPVLDVKEFTYQVMPADEATLPTPRGVALGRNDEVIILDKAGRVLVFDGDAKLLRHWWMPEYAKGKPEGACQMKDGRIAVADTHYSRIVIFDQQGNVDAMFGTEGRAPGQFIYPVKVVQDDKEFLYVVEYGGNDRIQKFTPRGEFVLSFGSFSSEPGGFSRPGGIVWHDQKVYVADADNHRIQAFHDDGRLIGVLTDHGKPLILDFPYDLAMGPDGLLYVIEYGAGRLTALTTDGELIGRYGSAGRGAGQFSTPWGIRVDRQKRVWIADTGNRRVVELRL
jgi:ABC-type multidrug transport system ATPase subunit